MNISEETYDEAINELTKLNPRPGSSLGDIVGKNFQQIIPDFLVETEEDGSISLTLNNGNVPELRLSREFNDMLEEFTTNKENQSKESKDAFFFLKLSGLTSGTLEIGGDLEPRVKYMLLQRGIAFSSTFCLRGTTCWR